MYTWDSVFRSNWWCTNQHLKKIRFSVFPFSFLCWTFFSWCVSKFNLERNVMCCNGMVHVYLGHRLKCFWSCCCCCYCHRFHWRCHGGKSRASTNFYLFDTFTHCFFFAMVLPDATLTLLNFHPLSSSNLISTTESYYKNSEWNKEKGRAKSRASERKVEQRSLTMTMQISLCSTYRRIYY